MYVLYMWPKYIREREKLTMKNISSLAANSLLELVVSSALLKC